MYISKGAKTRTQRAVVSGRSKPIDHLRNMPCLPFWLSAVTQKYIWILSQRKLLKQLRAFRNTKLNSFVLSFFVAVAHVNNCLKFAQFVWEIFADFKLSTFIVNRNFIFPQLSRKHYYNFVRLLIRVLLAGSLDVLCCCFSSFVSPIFVNIHETQIFNEIKFTIQLFEVIISR